MFSDSVTEYTKDIRVYELFLFHFLQTELIQQLKKDR